MDGEKEKEQEKGEEKESDEAENFSQAMEGAALEYQERYPEDDLGLPIMHWEALSLRISELEKQEEDRRSNSVIVLEQGSVSRGWIEEREQGSRRETWEGGADEDSSRVTALTSRLQTQMNLQLCFINNSESEDEDDGREACKETSQVVVMGVQQTPSPLTNDVVKPGGLQIDDEEKKHPVCYKAVMEQRRLNHYDLQILSFKQLNTLMASMNQAIHDLSSELVGRLLIRDQLRTKQDAMLLEVQDMTFLQCDDQRSPCNFSQ